MMGCKPETNQTLSNYPYHETSIVWDETGFIPPVFCRTIVEFLHILNNNDIENIYDADIIHDLICETVENTISGCSEYIFTDREKMYRFAGEINVPVGNMNDTEIADMILCRLIDEYTGDNTNSAEREDITEVLYKISTYVA